MRSRFTSPRSAQRYPGRMRTLSDRQVAALRFLGSTGPGGRGEAGPGTTPLYGQVTRCIAYMCPWAYACDAAAGVPSAVDQRSCHRFRIETHRPDAGLSEHSVDVLAEHRRAGYDLGEPTRAMLDEIRPDGPSRNLGSRRPRYPLPVSGHGHTARPA